MKTYLHLVLLASVSAFVSGCITPRSTQFTSHSELAGPPDNQHCRIFLMRQNTFQAGGAPMLAFDGEKPIGTYGAKGYLVWDREPGRTELYVTAIRSGQMKTVLAEEKSRVEIIELYALFNRNQAPVVGKLKFDASPGRTYYVTQTTQVPNLFSKDSVTIDLKVVPDAEGGVTLKSRKRASR